MRVVFACLGLMALLAPAGRAQAPERAPSRTFEVASVKRSAAGQLNSSFGTMPGGVVVVSNQTLRNLIRAAYRVQPSQMDGGPAWLDSDRFDINARAGGSANVDQIAEMLRALLADRFKLAVHTESREMPVLALMLARSDKRLGPQLRPSGVDCEAIRAKADGPPRPGPDGQPVCAGRTRPGAITARGVSMTEVARNITNQAQSLVVDRTGLTGTFDLDLEWTPDATAGGAGAGPADGPSFSTALQEQLGLKLERTRAPVEYLVIDRAEPPSPD